MIGEIAQVALAPEGFQGFQNPWVSLIGLGLVIGVGAFVLRNDRDKGGPGSGGRELRTDEGQLPRQDRRPRLIAA